MKKVLTILILFGFLLPCFSFAQAETITPPETLEEAKEKGEKALKATPGILERVWKEEVLPFWQKMYGWFRAHTWPTIKSWFKKIQSPIKEEIERRKPVVGEEFQKEKEELKEEVPKAGKALWEKFKELIK